MAFDNAILNELSEEGKQHLGPYLQKCLDVVPSIDRYKITVGIQIKILNPVFLFGSLTDGLQKPKVNRRLNCKIFCCVMYEDSIMEEYELIPTHLTTDSFMKAEKFLRDYNIYWNGDSMFVVNE